MNAGLPTYFWNVTFELDIFLSGATGHLQQTHIQQTHGGQILMLPTMQGGTQVENMQTFYNR